MVFPGCYHVRETACVWIEVVDRAEALHRYGQLPENRFIKLKSGRAVARQSGYASHEKQKPEKGPNSHEL